MSELARKLEAAWSSATKLKTGVTDVTTVIPHIPDAADCNPRRNSYALEPPNYVSDNPCYAGYAGNASDATKSKERDDFEERAAIAQHCGGLSPAQAEVLAALHVAELGPERDRIIGAAARVLDCMAEIKRSAEEFDLGQETSTFGG
jgi:hypothetical protein